MSTLLYDFNPNTLAGSSGTAVSSLADSQGSGVTLSQGTGANQPTISTSAFTGFKTLNSTGSKWMGTGTFSSLPAGSVIFFVFSYTQGAQGNQEAVCSNTGSLLVDSIAFFSSNSTTPLGYRVVGGTQRFIVEIVVNGSSSELRVNGSLAYTGSFAIAGTITQLGIFSNSPSSEVFGCVGDFARMQVYSVMNNTERAAQRESLASTYGITLAESDDLRFTASTGTLTTSGRAWRIHQSANYSSGTPAPVMLFCHGSSGSPNELYTTAGLGSLQDAILKRGGVIAAFQLSTTYTQTTLQSDIAACNELIAYLQANFNIKTIIIVGESRGGICSQVVLSQQSASVISGFYGLFPCCDATAWYSTSDPTLNPLTITASNFNGKRMQWNASTGDTAVPKNLNSDAMYAYVAGNVAERVEVTCNGAHGDISHFGFNRMGGLIDRCSGVTPEYSVSGPSTGQVGKPTSAFTLSIANASFTDPGNSSTPTISSSLTFDGQYSLTLAPSNGTLTATDASGTIVNNGTASVKVTPGNGETSFTFTVTAASAGTNTIAVTNPSTQGWTNPASQSFNATSSNNAPSLLLGVG